MFTEILRFFFGTGWWIVWHLVFLLFALCGVLLPMAAIAGDALKQPPPTASLGTFGCVMCIAVVLGLATPVGVDAALRAGGWRPGWSILVAVLAGAAAMVLLFWLLAAMASRGGRPLVTVAWVLVLGLVFGHLAALRWASATRAAGAASVAAPPAPPRAPPPPP